MALCFMSPQYLSILSCNKLPLSVKSYSIQTRDILFNHSFVPCRNIFLLMWIFFTYYDEYNKVFVTIKIILAVIISIIIVTFCSASKPAPLPEGQDTFGLSFRKQTTEETVPLPTTSVVSPKQDNFRCDVCNVSATCQEQIDMHFNGQKHQKKLKQLGLGLPSMAGEKTTSSKAGDLIKFIYFSFLHMYWDI